MMKRGPQKNVQKKLSVNNLLNIVSKSFEISDPERLETRGKTKKISLKDCLMSAFAMFSLKYPSLLSFDNASDEEISHHNTKKLYKIKQVPSDTYMRERLDSVDPQRLRGAFQKLFAQIQRSKLLEQYEFLGGYLLACDGTEIFNSKAISCESCCKKNHRDGSTSYYHQIVCGSIVHPNMKQVIPLCPEPIVMQDGTTKNDCESNAMRRFLKHVKREHPKMKFTIASDALSANAPPVNLITELGWDYIINAKPKGNSSLFEFIDGLQLSETKVVKGKNIYRLRYINNVPLNNTIDSPDVNFLLCDAEELVGKKIVKKTFSWITSHTITDKNVYQIMRGGRARWKIENETFNTLKTQGYQFEHNFGHGKKNLHTIFAMIMMLAFFVDQIQESACGLFQAALKKSKKRGRLWGRMQKIFFSLLIENWEGFYQALAFGHRAHRIAPNTS